MNGIEKIGEYFLLMGRVFRMPDRWRMFWRQMSKEMEKQGLESILITLIVSVFMGAIMTLQTKLNTENPLLPAYSTGLVTRDCILLEFSSTILCLLLAGKVGSNIASEIGTMRITEQIDALEIMGVNSASYLILPKVIATVLFFPLLTLFSIFVGILGGYAIAAVTGIMLPGDYISGLLYMFVPYSILYALVKGVVFAFLITTISAYWGYYAKGNSLEVGRASTRAVVSSSVAIMIFDLILTQIMRA